MSLLRAGCACLVLALPTTLTACTSGGSGSDPSEGSKTPDAVASPSTQIGEYVALGDSYTAGPLVPVTDPAEGCFRSSGNYPALLAGRLGVALTDVSCSAADTEDLRRPQRTLGGVRVPAQLDALGTGTDLVTVGIGGNDLGLFSGTARSTDAAELTARIGTRVARALRLVRRKVPRATVLLVGYPRLVQPGVTCPQLPFDETEVAAAYAVQRRLDRSLRRAAERAGATYVDVFTASRGHDICADVPWVNGRFVDRTRAAPFHPFPREMRAVAGLVEQALADAS